MRFKANSKTQILTLRSIVIAVALMPINCYWIFYSENMWWMQFATSMSLFFNVVFFLVLIAWLNLLLKKYLPRLALSKGELLVIYMMMCISTSISALDYMQVLMPLMSHAFWFATPENEWAELFWSYIPEWLTVSDMRVLNAYYNGESSLYSANYMMTWIIPVLSWTSFIIVLLFVMLCINVILRKQWLEKERLSYPIIEVPFEITRDIGSIFKNRLFLLSFVLTGFITLLNGISFLRPFVPRIMIRQNDISYLFTSKPWNAISWTPLVIQPFVVGMGFLMPLELSFSCWIFYFFRKFQRVFASLFGIRGLPWSTTSPLGFPYDRQQSLGAYLALAAFALWMGRRHILAVLTKAIHNSGDIDDSKEPISYRTATLGLIIGIIFLISFCVRAGMSWWVAVLFFSIYLAMSIGITRMRAESGVPAHDLHYIGPDYLIPAMIGTRRLGHGNLTMLSLTWFLNRAHRAHPMPHQLESFKMVDRLEVSSRQSVYALVLASVIGTLISMWVYLHIMYQVGLKDHSGIASPPLDRLQQWLTVSEPADYPSLLITAIASAFTFFLVFMRTRFAWWPFHAAGYAVSGIEDWSLNWMWASLATSTCIKWVILRHGGVKSYRKAIPFFIGMILGEFVIGSIWSLSGLALGIKTYAFKNW